MSQNGLPSKSKKRSPGEGSGRSEKPLSGCGSQEAEDVRAGLARVELQLGLLAQLRPGVGGNPGRRGLGRRASELRERRDPRGGEPVDLRPVEPGDAGEVVDRVPVRVADRLEVADRAVVDGVRLGRRRLGDEAPRAETGRAGSRRRTPAAGRTAARRCRAGRGCARARVPGRARAARCRRGAGGCTPASPSARASCRAPRSVPSGCAEQEVGDAAPAVVREDALVDDVDAGAHRLDGALLRGLPVEVVELDLGDRLALGAQVLEVGPLVLEPLAEDQLGLLVLDLRLRRARRARAGARASSGARRRGTP